MPKKNELATRIATGAIFVVVMLGGIYLGSLSFVIIFGLVTAGCLIEFLRLLLPREARRDKVRYLFGLLLGLAPAVFSSILHFSTDIQRENLIATATLIFFPLIFSAFIYELYTASEKPFMNVAYQVLGVAYIGFPFALLDFIAFDGEQFYQATILGLLLMSWMNDTGAYLVGSNFGKNKLFPRISPGKTWEGTGGGILITLGTAFVMSLFFDELSTSEWLFLGLIVSVFGNFGDLVESMLKRSVGVKDSGTLLPGHGGLLDRFDAFIFVLPFAAAYLLWIR